MGRRTIYRSFMIGFAFIISLFSALPAFAEGQPAAGATDNNMAVFKPLGQVKINSNSYFQLDDVKLLSLSSGKTIDYTVTLHNGGQTELSLNNYWVYVLNKAGATFDANLMPEDQNIKTISPKTDQKLHFYTQLNDNTNLEDLIFKFTKFDFNNSSANNFQDTLGKVAVPADYSFNVPAGKASIITISQNPIKGQISQMTIGKNETSYLPKITLTMDNIGTSGVKLPGYSYAVRTKDGLVYPLTPDKSGTVTINPLEKTDITLTGTVPVAVKPDGWQLTITQDEEVNAGKISIPVAFYNLPKATTTSTNALTGDHFQYTNNDGTYDFTVDSMERLAWNDQDILSADVTIANHGNQSVPIPKLKGQFLLDGSIPVDASNVKVDNVIGIPAGQSVQLFFVGKIPYTYQFSTVKLKLTEALSDSSTADVLTYNQKADFLKLPTVDSGSVYSIHDIGFRTTLVVKNDAIYQGTNKNVIYARLDYKNLEKRFKNVMNLVAYFKTKDGYVYPATMTDETYANSSKEITPNGLSSIGFWSNIPRKYTASDLHLIIGQGIASGHLAENGTTADGVIKAVKFALPAQSATIQGDPTHLSIFPYVMHMTTFQPLMGQTTAYFNMNFSIDQDLGFDAHPDGHQLLFTMEDDKGNQYFSKSYDVGTSSGSSGSSLTVGDDSLRLTVPFSEMKIPTDATNSITAGKFDSGRSYALHIYDMFQGKKKQLVKLPINWGITTNW